MSYRCPLCLKLLNEGQRLTRHCTFHPERDETFLCSVEAAPHKFFCPDEVCKSPDQIENGVFLHHEGCQEHNPFWNDEKVDLPGEHRSSQLRLEVDFGTGVFKPILVQHWLISILRTLPEDGPEMWFPLMLLRATGESSGGTQVGHFIELAGATSAGKTILAVQATNPHGYASGFVDANDFTFSRRDSESLRAFHWYVETLHLSSLLRRGNPEVFLPQGTPPGTRNLRAAFIKPSDGRGLPTAGARDWKAHARHVGRRGWRWLGRFMREDVRASFKEMIGEQGFRPYWHTIVFYDNAGEVFENEDLMRDTLDKVAVLVNATELFGGASAGGSEKSIEVAVQRLRRASERKQVAYLVVTQLDRVRAQIGDADWVSVQRLADDLTRVGVDSGPAAKAWARLFPKRPSEARLLLEKWLGPHPTGNRRQLKERLKDVEEIFFVWTEDLPTSYTPTWQQALPRSHGLARFVCRCLDIEWEQINRGDEN